MARIPLIRLRRLANISTSSSRIELHQALSELESTKAVWAEEFDTFEEVLKTYKLADPETHLRFKRALSELGLPMISQLGFWAATRLILVEQDHRQAVLGNMLAWLDSCEVWPTYQAVEKWLREEHPELFPSSNNRTEITRAERLRAALAEVTQQRDNLALRCQMAEDQLNQVRGVVCQGMNHD